MDSSASLNLHLDTSGPVPIGGTVRGRVETVADPGTAEGEVVLMWRAFGPATDTDVTRPLCRQTVALAPVGGHTPFALTLPFDVPSHQGETVRVRWMVQLLAQDGVAIEEVDVTAASASADPGGVEGPYRGLAPGAPRSLADWWAEDGAAEEVAPRDYVARLLRQTSRRRVSDRLFVTVVNLVAGAIIAVGLGGLILLLGGVAVLAARQGEWSMVCPAAVVGLLVVGPATVLGIRFVRRLLRRAWVGLRYGALEVDLDGLPPMIGFGETLELGIALRSRGRHPVHSLSWQLVHVENAARYRHRTAHGTRRRLLEWASTAHRHAEGRVEGLMATAEGTIVRVHAPLPARGPASMHTASRRLAWQLRLDIEGPHGRDRFTHELFVVPFRAP